MGIGRWFGLFGHCGGQRKGLYQGYSNGKTPFCVAVESGKILWTHQYPCEKAPKYFQGGSRSTPAISDGILYPNSHQGDFYALDAENGKILSTKNLLKDFGGRRPDTGFLGISALYGRQGDFRDRFGKWITRRFGCEKWRTKVAGGKL